MSCGTRPVVIDSGSCAATDVTIGHFHGSRSPHLPRRVPCRGVGSRCGLTSGGAAGGSGLSSGRHGGAAGEPWELQGSAQAKFRAEACRGPFATLHQDTSTPPDPCFQHATTPPRPTRATTMRLSTIAAGVIACMVTDVAATALTYKLTANEKACFYTDTKKDNEKIAFYFAVGAIDCAIAPGHD